ncbi:hypothetical protein [Acetobacter indonesiensis]|uniref:Uncharacterized protein n=1 Tax=Acetobacter indonesiensis TaxID=104101 RepID=A0A252AXQ9_9PROT|nr:hypothetical protein [Acetobacter indonesiensis]OUI96328.1 hypothetical protein HK17_11945 [Acetobacter indonesiensis]
MADENWTEQNPEDAEIDARADAILRANGIPEPEQNGRSFLVAVVLPVILAGILLIAGLWFMAAPLGLYN